MGHLPWDGSPRKLTIKHRHGTWRQQRGYGRAHPHPRDPGQQWAHAGKEHEGTPNLAGIRWTQGGQPSRWAGTAGVLLLVSPLRKPVCAGCTCPGRHPTRAVSGEEVIYTSAARAVQPSQAVRENVVEKQLQISVSLRDGRERLLVKRELPGFDSPGRSRPSDRQSRGPHHPENGVWMKR